MEQPEEKTCERWGFLAQLPQSGVADDDRGHKGYIIREKNKGWGEKGLKFSWEKGRIIHRQ